MFLVRALGLRSANALLKHFKSTERIFEAPSVELEALGIPPDVIEDLFSKKSSDRAEQEWRRATDLGVKIIDLSGPWISAVAGGGLDFVYPKENRGLAD